MPNSKEVVPFVFITETVEFMHDKTTRKEIRSQAMKSARADERRKGIKRKQPTRDKTNLTKGLPKEERRSGFGQFPTVNTGERQFSGFDQTQSQPNAYDEQGSFPLIPTGGLQTGDIVGSSLQPWGKTGQFLDHSGSQFGRESQGATENSLTEGDHHTEEPQPEGASWAEAGSDFGAAPIGNMGEVSRGQVFDSFPKGWQPNVYNTVQQGPFPYIPQQGNMGEEVWSDFGTAPTGNTGEVSGGQLSDSSVPQEGEEKKSFIFIHEDEGCISGENLSMARSHASKETWKKWREIEMKRRLTDGPNVKKNEQQSLPEEACYFVDKELQSEGDPGGEVWSDFGTAPIGNMREVSIKKEFHNYFAQRGWQQNVYDIHQQEPFPYIPQQGNMEVLGSGFGTAPIGNMREVSRGQVFDSFPYGQQNAYDAAQQMQFSHIPAGNMGEVGSGFGTAPIGNTEEVPGGQVLSRQNRNVRFLTK